MSHALSALLESSPHDGKRSSQHSTSESVIPVVSGHRLTDWDWTEGFWRAWKAVEQSNNNEVDAFIRAGIDAAIATQKLIFKTASYLLSTPGSIHSAGSFRWIKLTESSDSIFLCRPLTLMKLGLFLLEESAREQEGAIRKPIVLCVPIPNKGAHLVIAVENVPTKMKPTSHLPFYLRFKHAAFPPLPSRADEDEEMLDSYETPEERQQRRSETDEERRARYVNSEGGGQFAALRVKQDSFEQAVRIKYKLSDLSLHSSVFIRFFN